VVREIARDANDTSTGGRSTYHIHYTEVDKWRYSKDLEKYQIGKCPARPFL